MTRYSIPYLFVRVVCCVAVFIGVTGCALKFPTVSEQQYLIDQGSFPNTLPPWVYVQSSVGWPIKHAAVGLMPPRLRARPRQTNSEREMENWVAGPVVRASRKKAQEVAKAGQEGSEKKASPLDRIASQCAGMERHVGQALTTTDLSERIHKFKTLTTNCPTSADLWVWYGQDLMRDQQLGAAGVAAEKAVVLDSSLPEATELLKKIRQQQTQASAENL